MGSIQNLFFRSFVFLMNRVRSYIELHPQRLLFLLITNSLNSVKLQTPLFWFCLLSCSLVRRCLKPAKRNLNELVSIVNNVYSIPIWRQNEKLWAFSLYSYGCIDGWWKKKVFCIRIHTRFESKYHPSTFMTDSVAYIFSTLQWSGTLQI